ncbi:hypothetical protein AURDEDRAFT_185243 [Auricularia subglabra TFB-10046 SS5]|nr:hypothetical protein AURDEDRAFT_185243 [Auricularia subglabra TFB-10046 SS5]
MSNNFNALLNAAAVATTHPVPAVFAAAGAHAAAVQANAAAVHGAAAYGVASAATAAASNVPAAPMVPAAAGPGTTGRKMLTRQYAVVANNGIIVSGGMAVVNDEPVADAIDYQYRPGAATTSTQPIFPPGLPIPTHINGVRLEDTNWYKAHFATGTKLAVGSGAQHEGPEHRPVANEAIGAAATLLCWPPEPPTPSPPSRSLWSVVADAVTSCFKRKRPGDNDNDHVSKAAEPTAAGIQERPAKRARVEHVWDSQPSSRRLSLQHTAALPGTRKSRGAHETEPVRLSCKGVAASPTHYRTSDVAMQTDPVGVAPSFSSFGIADSVSQTPISPSPVAGSSRQPSKAPPSRTSSLTDAGAAGPARQPSKAPPSRTPPLTDAGAAGPARQPSEVSLSRTPSLDHAGAGTASSSTASTVGPIRTAKKGHVRFVSDKSHAGPRYLAGPPPAHLISEGHVVKKRKRMLVSSEDILACEYRLRLGAGNAASTSEPVDGQSSPAVLPNLTLCHVRTHPSAPCATYQDVAVQYEHPSPDAASGYKTRRGTRAGKKFQRRRAEREAATATASEGEADAKVDSAA